MTILKRDWLLAGVLAAGMGGVPASAQTIGVSISNFDDNFLTILREAIATSADEREGVTVQFLDGRREVGRQLDQVNNFAAEGVDGIIIAPVDSAATTPMTQAAERAGIPVVYVNNLPADLEALPPNQVFVGSRETDAGRLQGEEICRQLQETGVEQAQAVILMGDLSNQATRARTDSAKEAFATPECSFIEVTDEQTAVWQRTLASDLMTNWISAGVQPDAVVANNDEMAIGAILAMQSAGIDLGNVVVGGVDATPDALLAMAAGELDVTVFQNAAGQGQGALDAVLALIAGEDVPRETWVPFELVTPENFREYVSN